MLYFSGKGGEEMKRVGWIDAARYIAIFHVVFIHVLDAFCPHLLSYWVTPPYSYLPFLFCAKDAVLFFCVLLGFFAAKPRDFKLKDFAVYCVKRYFQFSFFIFCVGAVFVIASYAVTWVFHSPDPHAYRVICDGAKYNLIYALRDAFLLEDNYNPTLWSMQQFFFASIICYLLGCIFKRVNTKTGIVLSVLCTAAFLIPGSEYLSWIAFCVMGAFARVIFEGNALPAFVNKRRNKILLLIVAVVLFKLPESSFAYFMYAVASILLLFVCFRSKGVQRILGKAPLPALGRIAFGVYVIHTPVNSVLASSLYPLISQVLPEWCVAAVFFILCIVISTACSLLLDKAYRGILSRFA